MAIFGLLAGKHLDSQATSTNRYSGVFYRRLRAKPTGDASSVGPKMIGTGICEQR